MYNQGNHGHRPRMPMPPAYRQRPQAPPSHHFPQSTPALPPPPPFVQQVSSLVQSSNGVPPPQMVHQDSSFQVPTGMGQNAGRSYAAPSSQAHGGGGLYQNTPQHSQHHLHFGVQGHVRAPSQNYPPHLEVSKASTQGHHQLPPPPGGAQNIKHAPPLPLVSSGFLAPPPPPPPPPLQFSTIQNTGKLYGSESRPGGKDMNLDGRSNRAFPPLQFSSLPSTAQSSDFETRPGGEDMKLDGGSSRAFGADDRLLSTSCANMDLPSPPPKPMEERTVQKIEVLCKLIAQNGPDVEDKARWNESKNPEFKFLFGGDPGTEAAVVHDYFLWMKKKCILEHRLNEGKNNTLSIYQAVDSAEQHDNAKVSSGAESDMEMEDDFTLSEKDQMLDDSVHNVGDGHPQLIDKLNTSTQFFGGLNSAEEVSSKETRSGNESFPESAGLGRKDEGTEIISSGHDMIPTRSPSKFECTIVGSDETVMASNLARCVSIWADNISQFGASGCANETKTHIHHGELIVGSNPIRLSESYASEDNSDNDESNEKNITISTVSPLLAKDSKPACYLEDVNPKNLFTTQKGTGFTSHIDHNAYEIPPVCVEEVKIENQDYVNGTTLSEAVGQRDGFSRVGIEAEQQNGKAGQETDENLSKLESTVKVDEFGRLVREGRIDSDTDDDEQYPRKRKPNKRERSRSRSRSQSWSRSRSPVDRRRRRRRRSPFRRKEKQNRSRSFSPRNRRKRSRSPLSRRSRDFGGEYIRWNRTQNQDCFDFLRGRCYRGASCRYLHHETDKSAGSRRLRERRDFESPSSSKNSRVHEVPKHISATGMVSVNDEHGREGMHRIQHTTSNGQEIGFSRNHSLDNALQYSSTDHTRRSGHVTTVEIENSSEKLEDHNHFHDDENLLKADELPCVGIGGLENSNQQAQMKDNSCLSVLSPDGRSMTAPSKISASESLPNMSSSSQPKRVSRFDNQPLEPPMHSQPPNNLPPSSPMDMPVYPQHLPPAPSFPVQKGGNAAHMQPVYSDYGPIPQAASFPYQSSRRESFQPCQASLPNQYHQFSVPSNNSWTSFLPLSTRSPYGQNLDPRLAASHTSSQYCQSSLQPRDEHFPQAPTQGPSKPLSHMEASTRKSIPLDNSANQPILLQESHSASSLSFVTAHSQPKHFSREPALDNLQPSSTNVLPKEAVLMSCSPTHPHPRSQPAQESLKFFSAEGTLRLHGEAFSGYPSDPLDQSQPCHMLNIGGSRIPSHHNPYAPVFEQSLGSKSSSNLFRQNMDNQNANNCSTFSSLNHISVNDEGGCGVRPRPVTSSPKSAKLVAHSLLRSGGDQYDPLFDSIEPSNSIKKDENIQNEEIIGDSDIIRKTRSTYKALDAEENKQEEAGSGAVASTSSLNNGEYGETADAEVGDIESESLSTHVDVANMTTGEVEIDQDKSALKRKTKDSRSMKLFKVAVANFVKEVLKPSWRQGNMSKVAFKTIVKKTVDKVSGSMKGHHLPKSQAKIDQYIGSSQRKLTKLVMGYVDKYVKV